MTREVQYTFISIVSLTLGLSCTLIISLYLYSELTFDHYHENHESIYRTTSEFGGVGLLSTGYDIGPYLKSNHAQIEDFVRLRAANEPEFAYNDNRRSWDNVFLADPSVLDVFTIEALSGDIQTALDEPYSIAISESFSEYYFGSELAVGKILSTQLYDFQVTLVFEDFPENVTQRYDALLPFSMLEVYYPDFTDDRAYRLFAGEIFTYIHVSGGIDQDAVADSALELFEANFGEGVSLNLHLEQLSRVHFSEREVMSTDDSGNMANIYSFSAVAVVLLITSFINYINLATASASKRRKELHIRKILGASRANLIAQFVGESFLYTGIAVIIAILLSSILLRTGAIEGFTGKTELVELLLAPRNILFILASGIFLSGVSGIYPAIYLTSNAAMGNSRSTYSYWRRHLSVRRILALVQISISIGIVACSLIMNQQMRFINDTPLGFKKDNQIVIRLVGVELVESVAAISTELVKHGDINSVTTMTPLLGNGMGVVINSVESENGETTQHTFHSFFVGTNFLDAMDIGLVAGREFGPIPVREESGPLYVNETFVKEMGWEQPIGKTVGNNVVIGVVHDFHYQALHEPIQALAIYPLPDSLAPDMPQERRDEISRSLVVNSTGENMAEMHSYIDQVLANFTSESVPERTTLDEVWSESYDEDVNSTQLIGIFAFISVLISLLGLAGLATFDTQQRQKEIAVRKVLGASIFQVLALLLKNFAAILAISIPPAILATLLTLELWLERFALQSDIGVFPFVVAILIVSIVSMSTIIAMAYNAAACNPIEKLRYE